MVTDPRLPGLERVRGKPLERPQFRCYAFDVVVGRRYSCGRPHGHAMPHVAYKPGTAEPVHTWTT